MNYIKNFAIALPADFQVTLGRDCIGSYIVPAVMLFVFVIILLLSLRRNKIGKVTKQLKAPEDVNPAEVNYIATGEITPEDLLMLLYYWDAQGHIKIESDIDTTPYEKLVLRKGTPLEDSHRSYEKLLYNGLWKKSKDSSATGSKATGEDFKNCVQISYVTVTNSLPNEFRKSRSITDWASGWLPKAARFAPTALMFLMLTVLGFIYSPVLNYMAFRLGLIGLLLALVQKSRESSTYGINKYSNSIFSFVFTSVIAVLFTVFYTLIGTASTTSEMYLLPALAAVLLITAFFHPALKRESMDVGTTSTAPLMAFGVGQYYLGLWNDAPKFAKSARIQKSSDGSESLDAFKPTPQKNKFFSSRLTPGEKAAGRKVATVAAVMLSVAAVVLAYRFGNGFVSTPSLVLSTVLMVVTTMMSNHLYHLSRYGKKLCVECESLRKGLEEAGKDDMEKLAAESPEDYKEIKPYALAFGLSEKLNDTAGTNL